MVSPEDRMSTVPAPSAYLQPDGVQRTLFEDWERGPIGLNDVTAGLFYQDWKLTWDFGTGNFTVTPQSFGFPTTVLFGVPAVTQCSFAFDKNGHVNVAYTSNGLPYLYWYDTVAMGWITTALPVTVRCPTLTLDDKRKMESANNDIILWWTEDQGGGSYTLYRALQRDRFAPLVPKLMKTGLPKNIFKCGMHDGLRVQLSLSNRN